MAGGKETPRQKLIGMMYLVLLALLALNVSSTVLEKFIFLNESLEKMVEEAININKNTITRITQAVEKKGSRDADVKILDRAKLVREETDKVNEYLKVLKDKFVEVTGGRGDNGELLGASDVDGVASYMLFKQPGKPTKGEELKKTLNDYCTFLIEECGEEYKDDFPPIALDGKDDPYWKKKEEHRVKSFTSLMFEHAPTAAAMATISNIEAVVMEYETKALDDLARQVGAKDVAFDKIEVVALPVSNVVAAGAKYEAQLFLAAGSSSVQPEMKYDGKDIEVVDGKGKISFTATPGTYDEEGLAKKSYKAEIEMKENDTIFIQEIEYFVAKPVVQVQSASVSALYLNCGNELSIQVPALGSSYNPSFSADGADVIPGKDKGSVTVIPTKAKVGLTVKHDGNPIETLPFKVRLIPKPTIELLNGKKPVNEKQGENIASLRSLNVRAVPDASFKEFLPKDARYKVTKWEVTLARGPRPVGAPMKVKKESLGLASIKSKAKPGDRLVVEIKDVQRRNFRNKSEKVKLGTVIKVVSLN